MTPLQILQAHLDYHLELEAPTREQQLGRERKTVHDYEGRVLVELFQNAVDRAEHHIRFALSAGCLLAANDASPVTIYPLGEAKGGRIERSDFHALCSSDTSQKLAHQQIGNKGIGFKSVFSVADSVDVWSRHEAHGWWGIRMRHPFTTDHARHIAATDGPLPEWSELWSGIADALRGMPAPSFYFPEPLDPANAPAEAQLPIKTVVLLRLKAEQLEASDAEALGVRIPEQLVAFDACQLHFVAARYPDKKDLVVETAAADRGLAPGPGWTLHPSAGPHRLPELASKTKLAFTETTPPATWLAYPPVGQDHAPTFHCFFPTQKTSGFSVDVHADFEVGQNRKELDLGGYNGLLAEAAAELHLRAYEAHLHRRADAWRFLDPGRGAAEELTKALQHRLFGRSWNATERWVRLVDLTFRHWNQEGAPWAFHQAFWRLCNAWWPQYQGGRRTWTKFGEVFLQPLANAGVPCVPDASAPHTDSAWYSTVALPTKGRSVMHRVARPGRPVTVPTLPAALRERVHVVADFPDVANWKWVGLQTYGWATLVVELRTWLTGALPSVGARWSPDDPAHVSIVAERMASLDADERELWLRFALQSALDSESSPPSPAEHLWQRAQDRFGAVRPKDVDHLRAMSALPLPVRGGGWMPACRVSGSTSEAVRRAAAATEGWGVLDRDALGDFSEEAIERLLLRLGCFPVFPVLSSADGAGLHLPFPVEALDAAAWTELLAELERSYDPYHPIVERAGWSERVRNARWLPIDGEQVRPHDAWRVPSNDPVQYTLLPVLKPRRAGLEVVLDGLGVKRLPRSEGKVEDGLGAKAIRSVASLAAGGDPGPEHRMLYRRLARAIPASTRGLPVLVRGPEDALLWAGPALLEDAVLVADTARHYVHFYPELLRVCAGGGQERATAMGVRLFDPEVHVECVEDQTEHDPAMKRRVQDALPWLMALSELVPLGTRLTPEEIVANWEGARVMRGSNVYVTLEQAGEDAKTIGLTGEDGTAILNDAFRQDDGTIWHDAHDLHADATIWLHRFAPWLADVVFGSALLTRPFRSLLERVGEDWDDDDGDAMRRSLSHIENHQGDPRRVEALRVELEARLLTDAQRAAMVAERRALLEPFGDVRAADEVDLTRSTLGLDVFEEGTVADAVEGEVDDELSKAALGVRAGFTCKKKHGLDWRREKEGLRETVLAAHLLRAPLASWTEEGLARLSASWEAANPSPPELARLRFTPDAWARAVFPSPGTPPSDEDLDEARELIAQRPIAALDNTVAKLRRVQPRTAGTGTVTKGREDSDRKKQQRGESAEQARARAAAKRLLRSGSPGWQDAIDRERASIREELTHGEDRKKTLVPVVWEGLDEGQVRKVLRIASEVNCGFDVLDVDAGSGRLLQIEVKSSAQHGPRHTVHLTPNELRRALQTRDRSDAAWRLELYIGLHRRVDLTATVYEALSDERVRSLVVEGGVLVPVDLELVVELGGEEAPS